MEAIAAEFPNFTWGLLENLCKADWHWGHGRLQPSAMAGMFGDKRFEASKKARSFKGGAGEILQAIPFLRWFEEQKLPPGAVAAARASFVALARVVELVQLAKFYCRPSDVKPQMHAAISRWRELHEAAYRVVREVPKCH